MRTAIVSDIHGNLTALEAVLADVRAMSPDLVLQGGDLANGSSPAEVVDLVRGLGWEGVMGNADEMLVRPASLEEFASGSAAPPVIWDAVRAIAVAVRDALGLERLEWMRTLPMMHLEEGFALVHASPQDCWRTPAVAASQEELLSVYGGLGRRMVVHGHTHVPSIRNVGGTMTLVDLGSVGLPYDGDTRASYLLVEDGVAVIRRVEYDLDRELKLLAVCGLPHADWTARMLRTASPQMP